MALPPSECGSSNAPTAVARLPAEPTACPTTRRVSASTPGSVPCRRKRSRRTSTRSSEARVSPIRGLQRLSQGSSTRLRRLQRVEDAFGVADEPVRALRFPARRSASPWSARARANEDVTPSSRQCSTAPANAFVAVGSRVGSVSRGGLGSPKGPPQARPTARPRRSIHEALGPRGSEPDRGSLEREATSPWHPPTARSRPHAPGRGAPHPGRRLRDALGRREAVRAAPIVASRLPARLNGVHRPLSRRRSTNPDPDGPAPRRDGHPRCRVVSAAAATSPPTSDVDGQRWDAPTAWRHERPPTARARRLDPIPSLAPIGSRPRPAVARVLAAPRRLSPSPR